ncbi:MULTISPECIES: hypothetical protein [Pseudomonas]|uniref:hypothetical protein n=1 Tax=Pseudomonas TaxID=286 RepID=UPI000710402D|nr:MULTISPECIES: hypothetical protein [Pseudomonas]KQW41060.1 hypothetical protein ASC85_15660 [Pseudomonas sp. Root401]WHS54345.1 hypothetical protein QLH64_29240 [Pseudomonas brassicacearum]
MDKEYSVFVNAAAIVLAPCALRRTEVDDLMNSVLLAQLVANKSLQRAPAADWHATYLEVLSVAWISAAKRRKDLQPQRENTHSPLEWVAAIPLDDQVDQQQRIMAVMERIAALPGSLSAMGIVRKHVQKQYELDAVQSPSSSPVRLLVIVAQSPVSMAGVYVQFNTAKVIEANPWGQCFDGKDIDGCVTARYFRTQLSETLFAPAREVIARKVASAVGDNIVDITKAIDDSVVLPAEEVCR